MRIKALYIPGLLIIIGLWLTACDKEELTTGIEGTVYRGPINPVEIVGQVNDEPFSATFHLYDDQEKYIKSFSSDING